MNTRTKCVLITLNLFCVIRSNANGISAKRFEVEFEWSIINFTWDNPQDYEKALLTHKYIPENNAMTGIKFYKNRVYIAMPRIREGTPVTLGCISINDHTPIKNPLITPYPNWQAHDLNASCTHFLESVQSMEIDADGVMWVIDGHRTRPNARCPPKLVLYDLNSNRIVHIFVFPEEISSTRGGFLNDIVVDDQDGGFAYITDNSPVDPGLIVYSRRKNRAWKLRDRSMFSEKEASGFEIDGETFTSLSPIDGVALSPKSVFGSRWVFYCSLTGFNLYGISTDVLRNESLISSGGWRNDVNYVGAKRAQSDGMVIDNRGNLYYGLIPLYGVGNWNIQEDFTNARIVDVNDKIIVWTDSFAFDNKGYLYLLSNKIHRYFNPDFQLELTNEIKFRILKFFTATLSYLY